MGKKRNTAKTGDKAIYKSRSTSDGEEKGRKNKKHDGPHDDDSDPMYSKVDRFHNKLDQDFLKLDGQQSSSESDEEEKEAVMDLGIGGDDTSESEDDDDESEESSQEARAEEESSDQEEDEAELSESENEEFEIQNVRDWGKKKGAFYGGDTADLEIGQDEEDLEVEEEAAKEIQAARYEAMEEDDFLMSDEEEEEKEGDEVDKDNDLPSSRDMSKLSSKDRQKILDKQHPEMLPLLSYFSGIVKELERSTAVASKAIFEGETGTAEAVGTTKPGKRYLLTKSLLQTSTALNLAVYLLLKTEQVSKENDSTWIQSHPVMARLQKLHSLSSKLEERVEAQVPGLSEQLSNLVKAARLMNSGGLDDYEEEDGTVDADFEESEVESQDDAEVERATQQRSGSSKSLSSSEDESDTANEEQRVLNEARFGLRPGEIAARRNGSARKRNWMAADVGDDDDAELDNSRAQQASRSLATTLNTLEQKAKSRKRRITPLADGVDDAEESDGELRRGLDMMEEALGKDSDTASDNGPPTKRHPELDDEEDGDDFYAQVKRKSKARKEFKEGLYTVAPKYPRLEAEIEGERAVSRAILKNRGLVAHKSKLNRNPRVKKREQYRKALIRRKGAVRQVRTDEGHKYGGEETGIKTGITRSRKLAKL